VHFCGVLGANLCIFYGVYQAGYVLFLGFLGASVCIFMGVCPAFYIFYSCFYVLIENY